MYTYNINIYIIVDDKYSIEYNQEAHVTLEQCH